MAAWSESFVAIAASVSTTSTKQRVLIFRDEIPTILTNSGELLGCLIAAKMLRNWFLCFAYVIWTSSLWIFSPLLETKARRDSTLGNCNVCLVEYDEECKEIGIGVVRRFYEGDSTFGISMDDNLFIYNKPKQFKGS